MALGLFVAARSAQTLLSAGLLPASQASLSLRTGPSAQGEAAGLNVVGQGLGLTIGPLTGAALLQVSPQLPFLAAAILLVIAFALAIGAWRTRDFPVASEAAR